MPRRVCLAVGTVALLATACVPLASAPGSDGSPEAGNLAGAPKSVLPELPPLPSTQPIRVERDGRWEETDCTAFPADSYWHTDARQLPTVEPSTPNGAGLAGFPVLGSDPLRLNAGLTSESGKTITWASDADPLKWVAIEGSWVSSAEFSAVEVVQVGPLSHARRGLLRHRVPDDVLIELSSTDDHALFVDTDACTMTEYIRWNRLPGELTGRNATVNDLRTNERRLSVRPGWLSPANNGPGDKPLDSPYGWVDPNLSGMAGYEVHDPRNGATSSGGSGIPTSAGMVRLEEVFANPNGGSEAVDPLGYIDHAIAASLPQGNITAMPTTLRPGAPAPFVWPGTRSDGCAQTLCHDGSTGSAYHLPMGSRLRLSQERCAQRWNEPQAEKIVAAMCNYGIVITDSSAHFSLATERAAQQNGDKWRREAQQELATLTLRDFEIVDTGSVAAIDADVLWNSAVQWGIERYGSGVDLADGWFGGTYWRNLTNCERPAHSAMSSVRAPCTDPKLALVESAINGPDWWRTTR